MSSHSLTCANCRHAFYRQDKDIECRRYGLPSFVSTDPHETRHGRWPLTQADSGCGEWAPHSQEQTDRVHPVALGINEKETT